jgi:hypothetical protein
MRLHYSGSPVQQLRLFAKTHMNYDIEQFFLAEWLEPSAANKLSEPSDFGTALLDFEVDPIFETAIGRS